MKAEIIVVCPVQNVHPKAYQWYSYSFWSQCYLHRGEQEEVFWRSERENFHSPLWILDQAHKLLVPKGFPLLSIQLFPLGHSCLHAHSYTTWTLPQHPWCSSGQGVLATAALSDSALKLNLADQSKCLYYFLLQSGLSLGLFSPLGKYLYFKPPWRLRFQPLFLQRRILRPLC